MITDIPESAKAIYIFAHGAGAGMEHPFMETFAERLKNKNIGTVRFNFPYMEKGRKAPGSQKEAVDAIVDIYKEVTANYNIPVFAGGKSYGGRMASLAASKELLPGLKGLIYLGFPLHAPGSPSVARAEHLKEIKVPMLFLQGMKDKLAQTELIRKVVSALPTSTLKEYKDADHSFKVTKRSGINQERLFDQIVTDMTTWIQENK